MTSIWLLMNLAIWCIQAGTLIAVGIVATQLLQWRHPQSRLRFLQLLFVASLLLPFLTSLQRQPSTPAEAIAFAAPVNITEGVVPATSSLPWEQLILATLGCGMLVRLGLLGVGLAKLKALRRIGKPISIEGLMGVKVMEVDGLKGPAAFGWLDPVILLPSGMPDGPVRSAAVLHELQHVLRRDWFESMIEHVAVSILWFHPMVWWLMERVHLAREQAVDAEVAGNGLDRDQYLEVLLSSAGLANLSSMPATSFVRRPRHLVERVAFLTKETNMSVRKTVASAALAVLVSGAAVTLVSTYLPMQALAQEVSTSTLNWSRQSIRGEGIVQLEVTVNADGEAVDTRFLSGPEELRSQALQSVVNWRHTKNASPRRVLLVTINFTKATGTLSFPPPPPPPVPPAVEDAVFEGVDYAGLSPDQQQRASGVMLGLRRGQKLTRAEIEQLRTSLKIIDPSLQIGTPMQKIESGPITLRLLVHTQSMNMNIPGQVRVGQNVVAANLVDKVTPEYPALAKQARIQGIVNLNVVLGLDGSVENMNVASGHPLLIPAAVEAVKKYKYRPTLLNGQPIKVQSTVEVVFSLSE